MTLLTKKIRPFRDLEIIDELHKEYLRNPTKANLLHYKKVEELLLKRLEKVGNAKSKH